MTRAERELDTAIADFEQAVQTQITPELLKAETELEQAIADMEDAVQQQESSTVPSSDGSRSEVLVQQQQQQQPESGTPNETPAQAREQQEKFTSSQSDDLPVSQTAPTVTADSIPNTVKIEPPSSTTASMPSVGPAKPEPMAVVETTTPETTAAAAAATTTTTDTSSSSPILDNSSSIATMTSKLPEPAALSEAKATVSDVAVSTTVPPMESSLSVASLVDRHDATTATLFPSFDFFDHQQSPIDRLGGGVSELINAESSSSSSYFSLPQLFSHHQPLVVEGSGSESAGTLVDSAVSTLSHCF
mmetsp:Transcript_22913/g.63771  ORF Transcript_22913/g.63771 Transcript_22913/m.63771 type:complete len:304 (+) Transcript_22913:183-1094(+)